MADIVDRAQATTELLHDLALRNLQREIRSGQVLETAKNCCSCGEMIPSARQVAVPGTQHCVTCAEQLEAKARVYRSAA